MSDGRLTWLDGSARDEQVLVEVRGPGEWIVGSRAGGAWLHVYRLAPSDWLVSEVGRGNEGRGEDLNAALAGLRGGASVPDWWDLVVRAVGGETAGGRLAAPHRGKREP